MLAAAALLLLLAGAAIGATGIGGIVAVPALTALGGQDTLGAVAASSLAFGATGAAAWWRMPGGADDRPALRSLQGSALLGAASGAALAAALPPGWLRATVATLAMLSGLHALLGRAPAAETGALPAPLPMAGLGFVVGIGSALSGTGGPVMLLPLLMLLRVPLRPAIAAAQGVQLPVALAASAVHAAAGRIDWGLATAVAAALLAGWWLGDRLARRVPTAGLRRGVAVCLIATGLWYGRGSLY